MKSKKFITKYFPIVFIIVFGLILRIIGLNWDQGQHLHPDERFLTMVSTDIRVPKTIFEYLDPQVSSLNPYNNNYNFYVYGSLPINLVRILGEIFKFTDYDHIYLIGRSLTIILDTLIILIVFLITSKITDKKTSLIASFLYSICVLPIQLSHFFTVDPFLNFFIIFSFYFLISLKNQKHRLKNTLLLSFCFGFALASKISAIYFAPIIFLFFVINFKKNIKLFFKYGFIFLVLSLIIFRFCQPQVFISANYFDWHLNPQFIQNLKELRIWDKNPIFPPAIQWLKITPIIFPLKNILLWGLGIPSGIIFLFSLIFISTFFKLYKNKTVLGLVFLWVVFMIIFQGIQSVSTMRYFLPIYPFICIISAFFLKYFLDFNIFKKYNILRYLILIFLLFYPLMFLSIFFKNHSRVTASNWIYQNIPKGSTIATEYWDDALPLSVGNSLSSFYNYQNLHVADIENETKIEIINSQIKKSDYIILSSNRFYLPIPKNSDIFPMTTKYYQSLFDGSLGFQKVAEFTSYPCFPPIGKSWFCLDDTFSEEAFTVYDHPKVIIFKKQSTN
jgi:hypothetical protein